MGSEEKIKLTFVRVFDDPLSKYLTFKRISCMQWLFWVIYQKLKGGVGLAFGAHFLHDFSIKNIFYLTLYQRAKFQHHASFPSQDVKKKCVIKFLFRQLMISQTTRFLLDQPLKQWLTGRKRGED